MSWWHLKFTHSIKKLINNNSFICIRIINKNNQTVNRCVLLIRQFDPVFSDDVFAWSKYKKNFLSQQFVFSFFFNLSDYIFGELFGNFVVFNVITFKYTKIYNLMKGGVYFNLMLSFEYPTEIVSENFHVSFEKDEQKPLIA
eukprot:TRINITY_DN1107_c1_g1_i4.p1 TRINITY_DN1107_c1_g1~~TRINITY_DN1107_c1_g1_i4.p1  ORF type:complete len:142 (-),score=4.53 TRINITY_DN1107_c1_g1_i4:265-690(-)